jgi:basic amino acid/polyamine antiporter, APA family
VCGGVLLLPPKVLSNEKKFNLPYINGRFIVPALFTIFVLSFWNRVTSAYTNLASEPPQEVLFLVFLVIATLITIFTMIRKLSLIPILGMLCCLYLMIEIPTRSWMVFFGWMTFGLVIYFSYGYWKSKLGARLGAGKI